AAIAEPALLYLGVPPDYDRLERRWPPADRLEPAPQLAEFRRPVRVAQPQGTIPDFAGLSAREAVLLSSDLGLPLHLEGHGAVAAQLPQPGTPLELAGEALHLTLSAEAM
ncbi:MAG: PASTA domain-containing protein, partial [Acidobacteriota bacterium]